MASLRPHGLPTRYVDVELVARGGMADVFRATDSLLGRAVAIKMLAERFAADDDFRTRFTREALTAASLSHPNVVTIFDVGETDGTPYLVMEYLAGGSLEDRLRRGRVPTDEALAWLDQAAAALDSAHASGIVHRDVKPGNLLLDADGEVHVSDFGIARAAAHDSLTSAGTILGTSGYMAPEQARGEPATPASDRYALGCVAFELLTGRRPFEADSPTAEAMLHAAEPPPRASETRRDLPATVDTVLLRALAKRPDSRPETATMLVDGLRAALRVQDEPTSVMAPPTVVAGPRRASTRNHARRAAIVAGVLALAGTGGAAALALSEGDDRLPQTVVVTETGPGTTDVTTVTVESPPASEPPPPPSPSPSPSPPPPSSTPAPDPSPSDAAEANDRAYAMMQSRDYEGALPILEDAYATLAGTGTTAEAYTAYNLAFTRFALGSCDDVMTLLDRSEAVQGDRKEIKRLRHRVERSCGGAGSSGEEDD